MSIRWNKISRQKDFAFGPGNWFHDHLPASRRIFFRRAFGIDKDRSPPRYQRDQQGAPIDKNKPIFYRDDPQIIEAKGIAEGIVRLYAGAIYAQPSQVIQAIATNRRDKLVEAIIGNIQRGLRAVTIIDNEAPDGKKTIWVLANDPHNFRVYKGSPQKIDRSDIETEVERQWDYNSKAMTDHERRMEAKHSKIVREEAA